MKRVLLAILVATLGGFAAFAAAQPMHGGTPLAMLGKFKSELNLNTSQQQQWDAVMAQTKAAHDAGRANHEQLKAAMQVELAKPEPDFAALATLADNVREQSATLHKQTRNAWLGLYATFTPEQKLVARDAIKAGIDRMQQRRAMFHGGASRN
jgi:Spy/CpxP family protein refolding chaperone